MSGNVMSDRFFRRYQPLPFPFRNAVMLPLRPLPLPMGGNGGNADPNSVTRTELYTSSHGQDSMNPPQSRFKL